MRLRGNGEHTVARVQWMTKTMKSLNEVEELADRRGGRSSIVIPLGAFVWLPGFHLSFPSFASYALHLPLAQNPHMLALTLAWRTAALTTRESEEWGTKGV